MQATQLADATEVFGSAELSLEPKPTMPIQVIQAAQPPRVVTPADLLNIAMNSGDKDMERMERLMQMDIRYREMQEADRKRDAEIAFEADFVGFTGENISIPKTKQVDRGRAGSFAQAEFNEVCDRLKPALSKHGFGFRHKETFGAKGIVIDGAEVQVAWVWVICILSHRGGHKDVLELDGPADTQSANTPLQNAQSAGSYMKRQSLLAITGTSTGGEDDENRTPADRTPSGGGGKPVDNSDELADLMRAGSSHAAKGMPALTSWWGALSKGQRDLVGGKFGDLKKSVKTAGQL